GFYRYDGAGQVPVAAPEGRSPLSTSAPRRCSNVSNGARACSSSTPSHTGGNAAPGATAGAALCLLAPLGADVSAAARRFAVDPTRSLAIDVLSDLERHRCLMACPATRAELQPAAGTLFARVGVG
ncbi:3-hydroxyacyl-CoA dehydrogenase, partial [Pseudomonas aeruginosa]